MKKKKIIIFIVIILFTMSIPLIGFVDLSKNEMISSVKLYPNMKELQQNESSITEKIATATVKEDTQETISNMKLFKNTEITTKPTNQIIQNTKQKKTESQIKSNSITQSQSTPNMATSDSQIQIQEKQTTNNNTESFKINNAIINKMKSIINNNPSANMQKFGYTIVVDSSIVNKTTGFTFTEARVKSAINNSFGTIKIYARDYYVGNELRWTESFVF